MQKLKVDFQRNLMSNEFKKIESSHFLSGIPVTHKDSHLSNFENKYQRFGPFWGNLVKITKTLLEDPKNFPKFIGNYVETAP